MLERFELEDYQGALQALLLASLFLLVYPWLKFFFFQQVPFYTKGEAYFGSSIVVNSLNKPGYFLSVFFFVLPLLIGFPNLVWDKFDNTRTLRGGLFGIGFVLVWLLLPSGFNYVFLQWHLVDRILLALFWFLVLLSPVFVAPFIIVAFALMSQVNFGPEPFTLVFYTPVLHSLILFTVFLYLKTWFSINDSVFLLVFFGLIVTQYFTMGWAKASLGEYPWTWAQKADLSLGLMSFRYMNCLDVIPAGVLDGLYNLIKTFNRPLVAGAFLMEITPFLLLISRKFSTVYLVLFNSFHLVAFLTFGVFFWPWILVNTVALILLFFVSGQTIEELYSFRFVVTGGFVCLLFFLSGTVNNKIGWWNLKSNYSLTFLAENREGKKFRLSRGSFSPFDVNFPLVVDQEYLINRNYLPVSTYDDDFRKAVNQPLDDAEDFHRLRNEIGLNYFRKHHARRFKKLIGRYVRNFETNRSGLSSEYEQWLSELQSPFVVCAGRSSSGKTLRDVPGSLDKIHLQFREGFFNGNRNVTVDESILHTIDVQAD